MSIDKVGYNESAEIAVEDIGRRAQQPKVEFEKVRCLDGLIDAAQSSTLPSPYTSDLLLSLLSGSVAYETAEGFALQCLNTRCSRTCTVTLEETLEAIEGTTEGSCHLETVTAIGSKAVTHALLPQDIE